MIGSYDPASKKVDWVLGTGQARTHMVWVSDDQKRIVTSNVSAATMTIIDKITGGGGRGPGGPGGPGRGPGGPGRGAPQVDWDETVVPVGRGAEGFDVSPDGKELWAANAQDGTISILDLASKKVTQTLNAHRHQRLYPPALYARQPGHPTSPCSRVWIFAVVPTYTRAEVKRIPVGRVRGGNWMAARWVAHLRGLHPR